MREIKFRAMNEIGNWAYFSIWEVNPPLKKTNFKHLCEYVGRKDEQKKEIYVGDIMEYLNPMKSKEEYARDPYTRVIVKWNSKELRYENCFRGDIVGNIYEEQ